MSFRRAGLWIAACLVCLAWRTVRAAPEPLSSGEKRAVNFAFATELGSGIYDLDGRTVQIYRIPLATTVRAETAQRWGFKITWPLNFGFYDFQAVDVVENGLPEQVDTVSLVPGIEFRVPAGRSWLLKPYVEAGYAWDRSGAGDARVYSGGLRSLAAFQPGSFDLYLGHLLMYARVEPRSEAAQADDYVAFDTSLEARHGLGFDIRGQVIDYGLYASVDLAFDQPEFPLAVHGATDVRVQYEAGVTFGTRTTVRWIGIPLPRIGVGYRFGDDVHAFRVVFGVPTPALRR